MTANEEMVILTNDVRQTREAVIRMEGLLNNMNNQLTNHENTLNDHETRLRGLEASRWPLAQITTIVAILGLLAAVLVPIFFG